MVIAAKKTILEKCLPAHSRHEDLGSNPQPAVEGALPEGARRPSTLMEMRHLSKCLFGGVLSIAPFLWSSWLAYVIACQGDYMIGFHPVVLLSIPVAVASALSGYVLLAMGFWKRAIGAVAGAVLIAVIWLHGGRVQDGAWERSIARYSVGNQEAVSGIVETISIDRHVAIWEEESLTALPGFQWYCKNHIAAPTGVYYGFKIDGIPHVRIQKVRHGWNGIAFVKSPDDLEELKRRTGLRYEATRSKHWVIWML